MYVFIILTNIENHLSLVSIFLVYLKSKVNQNQEGKKTLLGKGKELFPRGMVTIFFLI